MLDVHTSEQWTLFFADLDKRITAVEDEIESLEEFVDNNAFWEPNENVPDPNECTFARIDELENQLYALKDLWSNTRNGL